MSEERFAGSGEGQQPMDEPAAGPEGGIPAGSNFAPAYPAAASGRAGSQPTPSAVTEDDRLMAGLAWLSALILQIPLVSLVLLVAEPNRSRNFQRYHSVASLAFWIAAMVYEMAAAVVYVILGVLTLFVGFACLWPIFFVPHAFALYYAYQAFVGKQPEIPVISDLIRRQGWA